MGQRHANRAFVKLYIPYQLPYLGMIQKFVIPTAAKEFDIVLLRQKSDAPGYAAAMDTKLPLIAELLMGKDIFAISDADIIYHKPCHDRALELLGDADMAAQDDSQGAICCGFMVFRPSEITRIFWSEVTRLCRPEIFWDQGACNAVIRQGLVNCVKLPKDEFFNCCCCNGLHGDAKPGWMPVAGDIPASARIVHAACVLFPEKEKVLDAAKALLDSANLPVMGSD